MKYRGILFDLDGVICHTDQCHFQAWKQIAGKLGIYFDETINNRLRGVSRMESFEIILERYGGFMGEKEKERYTSEKNEIYKELLKKLSPSDLSPEVKMTLDELRKRGLKLAVGSSSKNTCLILERLGLSGYFDATADGNRITHSKPDPEVFLLAARLIGEKPEDCLVVEDARAGLMAAKAGGMDGAGIGGAADCELADYHLNSLGDLLEVCKS